MPKNISVKHMTNGIINSLIDLFLWQIYLTGASFGKSGSKGVYDTFYEADQELKKCNHQTIRNALSSLKKQHMVSLAKRGNLYNAQITRAGLIRLNQFLPQYDQKRLWDNRIYLITYDISEEARTKRNRFRIFLYKIGCRLLQESTWITPYNPRELVNQCVKQHNIPGTIIVSDIGKDGGIGETTIDELIQKVYNLDQLNKRYQLFIQKASLKNQPRLSLISLYLSILKDDPQLPFTLLPKWFMGTKAHQIYMHLLSHKT
jgi:DNA-binding transcriptional regulator PaaX